MTSGEASVTGEGATATGEGAAVTGEGAAVTGDGAAVTSGGAAASTVPPIRREVLVDAGPAVAFEVFTSRIGLWWPVADKSVFGAGGTVAFAGGQIIELSADGQRVDDQAFKAVSRHHHLQRLVQPDVGRVLAAGDIL